MLKICRGVALFGMSTKDLGVPVKVKASGKIVSDDQPL